MNKNLNPTYSNGLKVLLAVLIAFFGFTQMNAQVDNTSGGFKIPAIVDSTQQKNPEQSEAPSSKKINPENSPSATSLGEMDKISPELESRLSSVSDLESSKFYMMKKEEFADPNQRHLERLNKKPQPNLSKKDRAILAEMAKDLDLGTFWTGSNQVQVLCRDYQAIDGDKVAILVNDEVVVSQVWLTGEYHGFYIPLKKGFNKISFKALNQGSSGPNTADLVVYDDKGNVISSSGWNLLTGAQADIVVVKE
ncbi:MAG: hypothetical protein CL868_20205 [Cytophagaceae bacterium]|nr:hypothetical protein [Cytophagaceae bacterium]|tara:strand:- start:936 stop:1688 length:753 start_codon:yes stop_codon:yes gene_type:complete